MFTIIDDEFLETKYHLKFVEKHQSILLMFKVNNDGSHCFLKQSLHFSFLTYLESEHFSEIDLLASE